MRYLGRLPQSDPLYGYLRYDMLPQVGVNGGMPDFRVFLMNASNHVYLYHDDNSHARLIGKFFRDDSMRSPEQAFRRMKREFDNLHYARSLGFTGYPHYIARPLGHNASLNCLLVEECCYGAPFDEIILRAIREGAGEELYRKLTALAYFLSSLHNRTASDGPVDFNQESAYFDTIVTKLHNWGHLGWEESLDFFWLKDRWLEKGCMWEDRHVLVHGDVTPANILFGDDPWVIAVDLERMKRSDRVLDAGRVAGELKHFFMQYAGDGEQAEPYIGHFLWEYSCHFPDRDRAFASITRRVPFYMALTLLRIARNTWIDNGYRRILLDQAKATLQ